MLVDREKEQDKANELSKQERELNNGKVKKGTEGKKERP